MQTKRIPRNFLLQLIFNAEKFWRKVNRRQQAECWPWRNSTLPRGYGQHYVRIGGKVHKLFAHRLAWIIEQERDVPKNKGVLHSCDNPRCCNPAHLFIGDQVDNMRDCVAKNRHFKNQGEKNPCHKLTEKDVLEIRKRAGVKLRIELAKEFGVRGPTVSNIIHRKIWRHI